MSFEANSVAEVGGATTTVAPQETRLPRLINAAKRAASASPDLAAGPEMIPMMVVSDGRCMCLFVGRE